MATIPVDERQITDRFGPHLSSMSVYGCQPSVEPDAWSHDPLLFLRPAMWHPAQGARQPVIGFEPWEELPVQSRKALPEGRQALPAGVAPRSIAHGRAARSVRSRRFCADAVRRRDRARGL